MAETTFNANSRSPRYSTSRATGFRGGQIDAAGNIAPPNYKATAGVQPKTPGTQDSGSTSPIQSFSAQGGPSVGQSLIGAAGSAAVNAGAKYAGNKVMDSFKNSSNLNFNDTASPVAGAIEKSGGGYVYPTGAETFPLQSNTAPMGTPLDAPDVSGGGDGWTNGYDLAEGAGGAAEGAASYADYAEGLGGAVDEFGNALDGAGDAAGGVPWLGAGIKLAQGNVGGAAGQVAGSVIGNAIFPGVGGAIGGFLGGAIGGGCFITEAVMAAGGQGDNAPELEILRQFRDEVMMATPEGQAMVREYYDVAPIVVDAISERPDGMDIFKAIKTQFIDPAVAALQSGNQKAAIEIYAAMINYATGFAAEAMTDDEASEAGVNDLGDHAAMMTHDDMSGAGMTQAGAGATDWAPPGNADPLAEEQAEGEAMPMSPGGMDEYGAPADAPPPGAQPPQQSPLLQFNARRF